MGIRVVARDANEYVEVQAWIEALPEDHAMLPEQIQTVQEGTA